MKSCKVMLWLCCLVLLTTSVSAQEKFSKVKIYPPADRFARNQLLGDLEIDHFFEEGGAIISEIPQSAVSRLRASKVKHEVLIPDLSAHLEMLNRKYVAERKSGRVALEQPGSTLDAIIPKPSTFRVDATKFGGYYSFAEMVTAMDNLVQSYPAIASKTSIGKTEEGRDIWVIKISDAVATDETNEPELLYMGLQHAREAITGASMIFFMEYLCENYAKDARIKALIDNREIYIIPCFNPDGWEYNRLNGGVGAMWRKNRSKVDSVVKITGGNGNKPEVREVTYTYGVDLNRNWGVDWSNCAGSTSCGSGTPSSDTYWGESAFSEKETQAVREFTKAHHFVAAFDQHAFGPYYSLPFGRKGLHTMSTKGNNFFTAIPALMGNYNGMRAADSYDALGYQVAGGFKDWMLIGELNSSSGTGLKDTVWAMTGEGGAGGGVSGNNFWAPASQIVNLCKGMCYQNLQLAYAAGTYVDIQDANDIALQNLTGTLNVRVKRLGLGNDPVTITLTPLENIQNVGAASVTIPGMAYYDEVVQSLSYKLPNNMPVGQRVRYAWQVSTAGYSYSDTIVKFYRPTVLESDDMEGVDVTEKWTVSGGWNYAADKAYGGIKALAESPGGNYTGGSSRIATYKNSLDLSNATASYLTFWTRHRAENFRDRLEVQVSANGGPWTSVSGLTTKQEPGTLDGNTLNGQPALTGIRDYWTQEVFDLSAYNGASALQFRFSFSSNNDGTSTFLYKVDDGFYIDNLSVIKSTVLPLSVSPLPVRFVAVSAKLLSNNSVRVNWEAIADQLHDHFEVERSTDGIHFINLGKATNVSPYQFIDNAPQTGTNYYRIKQFDKDGKTSYSKIVSVLLEPTIQLTLFPNPVTDKLKVKLSARRAEQYTLQITDVQGRVIQTQQVLAYDAEEYTISMQAWKAQLYVVKVLNSKNEVVSIQKLIKY